HYSNRMLWQNLGLIGQVNQHSRDTFVIGIVAVKQRHPVLLEGGSYQLRVIDDHPHHRQWIQVGLYAESGKVVTHPFSAAGIGLGACTMDTLGSVFADNASDTLRGVFPALCQNWRNTGTSSSRSGEQQAAVQQVSTAEAHEATSVADGSGYDLACAGRGL